MLISKHISMNFAKLKSSFFIFFNFCSIVFSSLLLKIIEKENIRKVATVYMILRYSSSLLLYLTELGVKDKATLSKLRKFDPRPLQN